MKRYQEVLNHFFRMLDCVRPQSREFYQHLNEEMEKLFVTEKHILSSEGKIMNNFFFLSDGYIIAYCVNSDNKKQVVHIYGRNEIVAGYSFTKRVPSVYTLVALPGAYMLTLSHAQLSEVYQLFPNVGELARIVIASREEKQVAFHRLLGEGNMARVELFYLRFPELLHVPGKPIKDAYIASYLGISEKTLRTCRKRLLIGK